MSVSVHAILQARMSSRRLPGKVLAEVEGRPMIIQHIDRIKRSRRIDNLTVATSTNPSDDPLCDVLRQEGVDFYRGSLDNVAERFADIITRDCPTHVVRLTADCPLADWRVIDLVVESHLSGGVDYTSNSLVRTFPKGLDVEIFRSDVFQRLCGTGLDAEESEHVTLGFYRRVGAFTINNVANSLDEGHLRWTVDYPSDLEFVREVYQKLWGHNRFFTSADVRALSVNSAPLP